MRLARRCKRNLPHPGKRFNEHIKVDSPTSWRTLASWVLKASSRSARYGISRSPDWLRTKKPGLCGVAREAEEELGEMTRRKREIVGLRNERDFPHLVELALPLGPFRSVFLEIDAFHRERRIPVRRGRSRYEVKPFHIRFCFPDAATADAFRNRFGGECLTNASSRIEHNRTKRRVRAIQY